MYFKEPLISIIVPVYNVSDYVKDCIKSIENQSYFNLEIIIVDDGSTDNSGYICDKLAKKDARIKVIHKKNGGLSDARNVGLGNIHGEYFCFVDSDDLIEKEYVETLYKLISSSDYQLAQIGTKVVTEDNKKVLYKVRIKNEIKELDQEQFCHYLLLDQIQVAAWCNIYLSKSFSKIRFSKGKINEDFLMWIKGVKNIRKVIISSKCLYRYRMRKGSITHSSKKKLYKACLENSKLWLTKIKKECPDLRQEAEYRYLYYLEMFTKEVGYKEYKVSQKKYFMDNFRNASFLRNGYITQNEKIYVLLLYLKNRFLIYLINKSYRKKN